MKSFLVLLVLMYLGFGHGRHTTTRPHPAGSVQYFTKQNQPININVMIHMDPALTIKLAKQYRSRTRNKLKEISRNILKDAARFFQHRSLNQTIRFRLIDTKFIRSNNNIVKIDENASKYLKSYCDWQSKKKILMKTPYYSVLLTGLDVFYFNSRGEEVRRSAGRGYMSGMCTMTKSCTLIEWDPKNMGFLLAHEIAHSLGVHHDELPYNHCNGNHVMNSRYNGRNRAKSWSECTQQSLKRYLQSDKSWCVKAEHQR